MISRQTFGALLSGAAILFPVDGAGAQQTAQPSTADQTAATPTGAAATQAGPTEEETDEEEPIVITGQKPRGSVVGDIPPEKIYDSRDVRATGATNINELLEALAPEIGSARGRGGEQPVLLLNGQRISSFRELRDIPTEAISRVEILPEEVALKYGYRADQRVVNIVLRQRFRSTVALLGVGTATEGGYVNGQGDLTRLMIQRNGRTTFNLHAEGNGMLTEDERDIDLQGPPPSGTVDQALEARSLIGTKRQYRGAATFNRQILGNVSATLNTELEHDDGRALIGLGETLVEPLGRDTSSDSAHAGVSLNWDKSKWHYTVVGNADFDRDLTKTQRDEIVIARDRSRETRVGADLTGTANGTLFKLPAGNATATFTLGGNTQHLDSNRRDSEGETPNSLSRTTGQAAVNLDLPISRRGRDFSALGNLTLNANAELDQLSDFGTLTTVGAGLNWSPADRLNLLTSWTREEGAPTIQQLGDPILDTPGTRIFDFTTGQTVLATAITGGNPDLLADRRDVVKVGGNWQPFEKVDLRFRADYVHSKIDRPIRSIFGPTPALEDAFPERFVREPCAPQPCTGQLISVDLRPINFDSATKDTLRIGFDFTKPLKSRRPPQSFIDQIRRQFAGVRGGGPGQNAGSPPGPPQEGAGPPPEGGRSGGGGFRGGGRGGFGGGGFGGGSRGRIQFSLTDTITFTDKVSIGPGLPDLDYLHGEAAGGTGGTPRHQVEAQAGWFNNGFGARLGANWRSATKVDSLTGDNLHFSSLATFNLRLFANMDEQFELIQKHPWLRGSQIRLEVSNIFDAKPKVHDSSGNVPLNYQPDLLDPLGRTIMISFRKSFLPSPTTIRRMFQQDRQSQTR